uniref:leucine-rich repeat and immunoglobulin-like domain-containing nogo receptor-interacting protein 1 n=1 Tax=Myxine glutinosa TaxID=7769 RepID=UPI00358FA0F9
MVQRSRRSSWAYSTLQLLLLALLWAGCTGCPTRCECSTSPNRTVICHRKRLLAVPEGIPSDARTLDLSKNRLKCITAGEFSGYPLLEELDLQENIISNIDPGAFSRLHRLRTIQLQSNRLKLIPAGVFAGLTNLTHLDISENRIVILIDHMFQSLHNLRYLNICDNDVVYISHHAFSGLRSLKQLTLERYNLTAVPREALSHLHRLITLRLLHLNINSIQPYTFRRMSHLKVLKIDHWPLLNYLPPNSLYGLNLTVLSITHCNLSAIPTGAMHHLIYLQSLNLSYNPLHSIPPRALVDLVRLHELHLVHAQLHTIEPEAFHGLFHLRLFNVSENELHTLEETAFQAVGNLVMLRLDQNPLACDCRLLWILRRRRRLNFDGQQPVCASPDYVQGQKLKNFPEVLLPNYFTCQPARIRSKEPAYYTVLEGHTAQFPCVANGDPAARIRWLLPQRTELDRRTVGRLLVLADGSIEVRYAQLTDSGAYTCVASNAGGQDDYTVTLTVRPLMPDPELAPNFSATPRLNFSSYARNGTSLTYQRLSMDVRVILMAIVMGGCSFLCVVLLCLFLLCVWSRSKGRYRHTAVYIDYVPRQNAAAPTSQPKTPTKVKMRLL